MQHSEVELTDSEALTVWIPRIINLPDLEMLTPLETDNLRKCFERLSRTESYALWNKLSKGLWDIVNEQPENTRKATILLKQLFIAGEKTILESRVI